MSDTKLNKKIGKRIQDARRDAGYRFAVEAAERLRVHVQNVRDHEAGRRTVQVDHLIGYAKMYGVSIDWLVTGKGSMRQITDPRFEVLNGLSPADLRAVLEFAEFKAKK